MRSPEPFLLAGEDRTGLVTATVNNPFDGTLVEPVYSASADDARHACSLAKLAFEQTRKLSSWERSEILNGSESVLSQAYAATRRGGTTITIGLPSPDSSVKLPAVSLVAEERTVKGSYMGSAVPRRDLPRFIALYRAGLLPVDRLLTHRINLDELNVGFDRLAQG